MSSKRRKAVPTTVGDFTILPLTLPKLPDLPEAYSEAKHYLYIKAHKPSHPTPSADQSLFVANVPIDASEKSLRALFAEKLGGSMVESVEFDSSIPSAPVHKRYKDSADKTNGGGAREGAEGDESRGKKRKRDVKKDEDIVAEGVVEDEDSALPRIWNADLRRGGSGAVVVFVDKRSCRGALKEVQKAVKEAREVKWKGGEGVGVERYKSHLSLRYPHPTVLQSSVNAYLSQFDAISRTRDRLRAHARSVPDEDGFITVTRGGGRTAPAARFEQAEQKKAELEERRKKNGVKEDFYRFQNREKRKERERELREGFERDRRRVAEMRERKGRVVPES